MVLWHPVGKNRQKNIFIRHPDTSQKSASDYQIKQRIKNNIKGYYYWRVESFSRANIASCIHEQVLHGQVKMLCSSTLT